MADIFISPFSNLSYGEPAIKREKNRSTGKFDKFLVWPDLLENQEESPDPTYEVTQVYTPLVAKDYDIHRYIARLFLGNIETNTHFEQDKKGNATSVELTLVGEYEDHEQIFERIALKFAREYGDFLTSDHMCLRPLHSNTGRFVTYPRLKSWFNEWFDLSYCILKKSVNCTDDLVNSPPVKKIGEYSHIANDSLIKRKIKQHTAGDIAVRRNQAITTLLPNSLAGYCWLLMARELTTGVDYEACTRRYNTRCKRRSDETFCQCTLPSSAPTFKSGSTILHCCNRCRRAAVQSARSSRK